MIDQQELEARYARVVGAEAAFFVYAERVDDAFGRLGAVSPGSRLVDMVGGPGLRVADVRAVAREVHAACGSLWVDITVPSQFGCCAFELGADVQGEALDRVAAGGLERKAVALAVRDADLIAHVGASPSHALSQGDLETIACGLDTFPSRMQRHCDHARALAEYLSCCERLAAAWYPGLASHPDHELATRLDTFPSRMQRHCDHARALAEYLSCCERLAAAWYPGLASHPDHELATRVLLHGFGPAVDFELPAVPGRAAGDFIDRCRLNGRACKAGGRRTRLHARDGWEGSAVRIFAGLDDPLEIADDLDQAMRWFCSPPQP